MLELINIPLLFRGFGVLFAMTHLLSAGPSSLEPLPKDIWGYILRGLLLILAALICVPFSRIRDARKFWILFSGYAAALLAYLSIQIWFGIQEIGTPGFTFSLICIAPIALLLLIQLPCMLHAWRHGTAEIEKSISPPPHLPKL